MTVNTAKIKIYDTHVHFWDLALNKHAWLTHKPENNFIGDYTSIACNYLPDTFFTEQSGYDIVGITHIQAGWDRNESVNETKWIQSLQLNYDLKTPFSCIGYANLTLDNIEEDLSAHAGVGNCVGIRQILNCHKNKYYSMCTHNIIEDKNFERGFKLLKKYNLHFELQAYSTQLQALLPLITKESQTLVIIEHCGMPLFLTESDFLQWKTILKKAALIPNTTIKLSGLGMFFRNQNKTYPKAYTKAYNNIDIVKYCIDAFGVERCVFGSNFPVDKLCFSYTQTLQPILECGLTTDELNNIFYTNACRVYNYENQQDRDF